MELSKDPRAEGVKGVHVRSVMFLGEVKELGPGEVRVGPPSAVPAHQLLRRLHRLLLVGAEEERQRPPLALLLHYRPMQAALVLPVGQCL